MTEQAGASQSGTMERWQRIARRIRVPLGFVAAALYLFELWRKPPQMMAILWSLLMVLPGLWLRGYASGYVKKNRELTQTGPYAYTRNPLYLGSILIAGGFAAALLSWPVAAMLGVMFLIIYVPVIASEERFLRSTFPDFDAYCRKVPRLIPRISAAETARGRTEVLMGKYSLDLYLRHREYNAAIGAALLYLSLLFLRPALGLFVSLPQ